MAPHGPQVSPVAHYQPPLAPLAGPYVVQDPGYFQSPNSLMTTGWTNAVPHLLGSSPFPTPTNSRPVCYGCGRVGHIRIRRNTQPPFSTKQRFAFNTPEPHYSRPPTMEYRRPESPRRFPPSRNPSPPPMANRRTSPSPNRRSRSLVEN